MYFYRISDGEYESYTEYTFVNEKKFTESEFESMTKTALRSENMDKKLEEFGFKKLEVLHHYHID